MGSLKGKSPGGIGWEMWALKWFYSIRQIPLRKKYLITFSQKSGKLCPYIHPKGDDRKILNFFENWQVMT